MKYRIRFEGCPIGRLNTAIKDIATRVVEADSPEAAQLKAYDTHEHIPGGAESVSVQEVSMEPRGSIE